MNTLLKQCSLKILQDDYGIVGNLVVSCSHGFQSVSTNNVTQPFTTEFPCADIHELLCSNLLHQIIKGTFKDDLITWVGEYLVLVHSPACAAEVMADIDHQ